ncbi:F-box/FBD/LRR-repeat protein At1g13570-like isoform X2 [Aristolochia californica]|uniref:F-box/FBD/LRR-repeat protein At1g13570-like isoform X2 n=1 Tax=Aristolochia californica TaxID=171875 RepID=UPI0035DAB59A
MKNTFTARPPSNFEGFSCLTALDLQQIDITSEIFESIVSKSPLLQRLQLISCNGLKHLTVTSPKLEWLFFHGEFDDIHFNDVPHLVDVTISLCNLSDGGAQGEGGRLDWYLKHLTGLKKLVVYNHFLKFLAVGTVPEKLPVSYSNLKLLRLHMNIEDSNQILAAFCLFRSSPNLEHIRIEANSNKQLALLYEAGFWAASASSNIRLSYVKKVEITGFVGVEHELEFVRLLLTSTPLLEKMIIEMDKEAVIEDSEQLKIVKKMMRFRRASSRAEVSFSGG